jgi:hypothetical protein
MINIFIILALACVAAVHQLITAYAFLFDDVLSVKEKMP